MKFDIKRMVRKNIRDLKPYSTARHESGGEGSIFLDANENSFGSALDGNYNRCPQPIPYALRKKLATIKQVNEESIFIGSGSDEAIDLLYRVFCEPGRDNVIIFQPTYGMYEVCADIHNANVKAVPLSPDFTLDLEALQDASDEFTKMIFICSPNNPTGNSFERIDIEFILNNFQGIVVIDEAYINYSRHRSFISILDDYPNLVVLQTLSKAWGLAGLRLGMAFANPSIIEYLNHVKYPYNISSPVAELAERALEQLGVVNERIRKTVEQRSILSDQLARFDFVQKVYPSDSNFLLVKMRDARKIFEYLRSKGIVVRDRSGMVHCQDCLRITTGNEAENLKLIETLSGYKTS